MLLTTQPDGSLLIEGLASEFSDEWKSATHDEKVVLHDGTRRPAIRKVHQDGRVVFTTIHPEAWAILKRLQRGRTHPYRQRLCDQCGSLLRIACEREQYWVFRCESCRTAEFHDKRIVGGTLGAGEREKT